VGGLCEEGVVGVARGGGVVRGGGGSWWGVVRGGGGWALGREQGREREKRKGASRSTTRVFGRKMVYGKFFRKPFSFFLLRIFRSN
jgi:hypothetical protein